MLELSDQNRKEAVIKCINKSLQFLWNKRRGEGRKGEGRAEKRQSPAKKLNRCYKKETK